MSSFNTCSELKSVSNINKTGLQSVSRSVELVPFLRGLGVGAKTRCCHRYANRQTDRQTDRQTGLVAGGCKVPHSWVIWDSVYIFAREFKSSHCHHFLYVAVIQIIHETVTSSFSDKLSHVQVVINCRNTDAQICTCEDALAYILAITRSQQRK